MKSKLIRIAWYGAAFSTIALGICSCKKDVQIKYQTGDQVTVTNITLEYTPPLTITGIYYQDVSRVFYNVVDVNGKKFSNVEQVNLKGI